MTNLDSILRSRDITLPTKVHLVKGLVFPVVMYGCEIWTEKKAECQIIDAFELWCWRRVLRVPWTARRSNQSILKEISSVQFSHSVMSNSLWPHGLQHARPPCPSPTLGVYSNSCPLSQWCHPTSIQKASNDAFELWCWRRLLRVPWTARRSNQSILKEISPGCSLVGLMLKLKLHTLATWCKELTHLKRLWC